MSDRTDDLQYTQEDTTMSFCNIRSILQWKLDRKKQKMMESHILTSLYRIMERYNDC